MFSESVIEPAETDIRFIRQFSPPWRIILASIFERLRILCRRTFLSLRIKGRPSSYIAMGCNYIPNALNSPTQVQVQT